LPTRGSVRKLVELRLGDDQAVIDARLLTKAASLPSKTKYALIVPGAQTAGAKADALASEKPRLTGAGAE
jgi:hypothetical protein